MKKTYPFYDGLIMKYWYRTIWKIASVFAFLVLSACNLAGNERDVSPVNDLPDEIVFYDWEDDIPQEILDQFKEETGITVNYVVYQSGQESESRLYYRNADYDVVVIDNSTIPIAINQKLLAELDYEHIPNFKYISINFRDLIHDPQNTYSIPFNWGTTGIIYLQNGEFDIPRTWSDLWEYDDSIKIGIRDDMPYDNLAFTKKMMGESINECDPKILENVAAQFWLLKDNIVWVNADAVSAIDELENGNIDMLVGWSDDVFEGRDRGLDIIYVLPYEGTMLWGDSFVIPVQSKNKEAAAQLINFLIDPKISARIIEYNNYASANDSVIEYLPDEIINDPIIFPDNESMRFSEIYMPVSNECNELTIQLWDEIVKKIQ